MTTPTRIGIAVVEHAGRHLVGVRGDDGPLPGKAEFPGGKCAPHESARDAAVRECREETGLDVEPIERFFDCTHEYPHGGIALEFWRCRVARPDEVCEVHRGFRWIPTRELAAMNFPAANRPVIERLTPR